MVHAGQLADPAAGPGRADHVLGPAVQHVALPADPVVEGEDAAPGDVVGEDPAHREPEVGLDALAQRRQQHPVEAGPAQRVADHRGGPKMAPGWVVTTSWPAAARAMASSKAAILVMV